MSNVNELLDLLEKSGTANHLNQNIDPTYNFNNCVVNSLETLVILLTKISCLPIVPDFSQEQVYNTIKITQEQSKMVQNFNQQLIYIHGMVEKFCVQQYVMLSMVKKIMDDTIINLIDDTQSEYTSNLVSFIQNYEDTQNKVGGTKNNYLWVNKLLVFFLLITMASSIPNEAATESNLIDNFIQPNKKMYGIVLYTPEQIQQQLINKDPTTSGEISLNNMLVKYDKNIKAKQNKILERITSVFFTNTDGASNLETIINSFNEDARVFSRQVENTCLELMRQANDAGIFKQWNSIDNIAETEDKIKEIENLVQQQTENIKEDAFSAGTNLAISALTGDPTNMAYFVASLGSNLWDYTRVAEDSSKKKKQALKTQEITSQLDKVQENIISATDMIELENKLFISSQLYCSYGYNLQINLTNTNIDIIGDVIPYMSILELIATLDRNLAIKITELSTNTLDETFKQSVKSLISIQQRLGVLKTISNYLYTFINFSGKKEILKMQTYATPKTIDEFNDYLNFQSDELKLLLDQLEKRFPLKEQIIKQKKQNLEAEFELSKKEQENLEIEQETKSFARQQEAELVSKEMSDWFNSSKTIALSWVDVGLNVISSTGDVAGNYTQAIVTAAGKLPLAGVKSIFQTFNEMLYVILSNPSGWVTIMSGVLVISIVLGNITGTLKVFVNGGKLFLAISVGTFLFVWKLIKTPFGFIWRKIDTLQVLPSNTQQLPASQMQQREQIQRQQQMLPRQQIRRQIRPPPQVSTYFFQQTPQQPQQYQPTFHQLLSDYQGSTTYADRQPGANRRYYEPINQTYDGGKFIKHKKTRKNKKRKTKKLKVKKGILTKRRKLK